MNDQRNTRREYTAGELHRAQLHTDPVEQFGLWFEQAETHGITDVTAMSLATADADGCPSVRIVLLKQFDADGFSWYTNYNSAKGRDLAFNPRAALLFYWGAMDRQVRISGRVDKLSLAEAEEYFHSRPLGSQISAAASEQSQVIASREVLEARAAELQAQCADGNVPRPADWGGYRLIPESFEFWQGRASRLHDRFRYRLVDGSWRIERLCP